MKYFTKDDASAMPADQRMRFYTTLKLGPKQSLTPEGFLLCEDVPLARTGEMRYRLGETTIDRVASDGAIHIIRDEAEVFHPRYIASLAGKPAVNDHPPVMVSPQNWRDYSVGVLLNPRRGTGDLDQFLLGDLLICDPEAIADVQDGKREVSLGYDAKYIADESRPGYGRQYDLVGNHVALVDSGRCGPRCAIGDRKTTDHQTGDSIMSKKTLAERIWAAMKPYVKDEAAPQAQAALAAAGVEEDAVHIHVGDGLVGDGDLETRVTRMEDTVSRIPQMIADGFKSARDAEAVEEEERERKEKEDKATKDAAANKDIEGELREEAPAGTADKAVLATDSAYLGDSFQESLSFAEILVPGVKAPVFDAAAKPKDTFDSLCKFRRSTLDQVYASADGRALLESVNGGRALDTAKMSCRDARSLMRAAAGAKKLLNNAVVTRDQPVRSEQQAKAQITTPAEFNAAARKRYGQ